MRKKEACTAFLLLLALAVVVTVLTGCDVDFRAAGRRTGELYDEAATRAALDPTARAETLATDAARAGKVAGTVAVEAREAGGTVAAEVEERAPTVAAKVEEKAPTAAAEAAEAAREFSEGVQETGACSGAAMILVGGGLVAAVVPRRRK